MTIEGIPPDVREKLISFRWSCGCGQKELGVSITRNGAIRGRCIRCGRLIYWNDPLLFRYSEPFCQHHLNSKLTKNNSFTTTWCPLCRIREFVPTRKPEMVLALGRF
jgi:hypothetical protein